MRKQAIRDNRNEAARVPPTPPATSNDKLGRNDKRFGRLKRSCTTRPPHPTSSDKIHTARDNKRFAKMSLESPQPGKRSQTSNISTLDNPRRMSSALSIESVSRTSSHTTRPHRSGDPPSFPSGRSSHPTFDEIDDENKFCEAEKILRENERTAPRRWLQCALV